MMARFLRWLRDCADDLFIATAPTFFDALARARYIEEKRAKRRDDG
jgi:hypothetical protein